MSRAFVREDEAPDEGVPERRISDSPNYVTPTGLAQLEEKVAELQSRHGLLAAAADDPSEDDSAAEDELAFVDRDLRYCVARLESAIVVDPAAQPRDRVTFGATVTVRRPNGSSLVVTIVGEDEADAAVGKVGYVSPLAEALLDARLGETVVWSRPAGDERLTVTAVEYPAA
jgi:transcription elongation factor GreB